MSSIHIAGERGDFAETVLLPGDPRRAKHIAATMLEDAVQVTDLRNMLGYTGRYRGERISVMGTGMGIPSTLIYATELVREFGVKRLVRVGTCGAVAPRLGLGDIVVALGAGTDSHVNRNRFDGHDFPATASWALLERVARTAGEQGRPIHVGNVFSSDQFYHPDPGMHGRLAALGFLAIEMEAAGLYAVAAELGAEAIALLTVSDHVGRPEAMTPPERETGVDVMVRLALDALSAP